MAFMGFWAVIKHLPAVLKNLKKCKSAIARFCPDVIIMVDYPSFNLRIAKFVKKNFNIPVYYYISPKLWAWKEYRIKSIKRYIDRMFTIFPFETEFYARHNYPVEYVGNPTVDFVSSQAVQIQSFAEFTVENHLSDKAVIALLPGSRRQEIAACLGKMLAAAECFPDCQPVIAGAPGIEPEFYGKMLKNKAINIIFGQTQQLLQHSHAAIVNSGTATLETALIGVPQVVVYHVLFGRLAYLAKKLFIKVKYVSLVNLIAQKEVVRELIAHQFTVENIVGELEKILRNTACREKMLEEYASIKKTLGKPGAAERAAKKIVVNKKNSNNCQT
jgi:lipid-A-disaccharide synthase